MYCQTTLSSYYAEYDYDNIVQLQSFVAKQSVLCLYGPFTTSMYSHSAEDTYPLSLSSMQEKLSLISRQIEQLLALLTASACASKATSDAVGELQRQAAQLQSASRQGHRHLTCMKETLMIMADQSAKAADVDMALRQLQGTMLEVGDQAALEVQRVCSKVLRGLSKDIGMLMLTVDQLQGSVEEMAADLKNLQVGLDCVGRQVATEAQLIKEGVHDSMASIMVVRFFYSLPCWRRFAVTVTMRFVHLK